MSEFRGVGVDKHIVRWGLSILAFDLPEKTGWGRIRDQCA